MSGAFQQRDKDAAMRQQLAEPCTVGDLRTHAVMTVTIEDGEPVYDEPCYEASQCIGFWCVNCDKKWKQWEEALDHLKTEPVAREVHA